MTLESPRRQEIYSRLTAIFHEVFDDDTIVLTPDLTAAAVPEWDSFNHINLIVAIEARLKIKFQTAELESIQSVGHLVDLIEKKLDRKSGSLSGKPRRNRFHHPLCDLRAISPNLRATARSLLWNVVRPGIKRFSICG